MFSNEGHLRKTKRGLQMKSSALEHSRFSLDWHFRERIPSWWLSLSPIINIISSQGNAFIKRKQNELLMSLWAVPLPLPGLERYNGLEICWCLVICPNRGIGINLSREWPPQNARQWREMKHKLLWFWCRTEHGSWRDEFWHCLRPALF